MQETAAIVCVDILWRFCYVYSGLLIKMIDIFVLYYQRVMWRECRHGNGIANGFRVHFKTLAGVIVALQRSYKFNSILLNNPIPIWFSWIFLEFVQIDWNLVEINYIGYRFVQFRSFSAKIGWNSFQFH